MSVNNLNVIRHPIQFHRDLQGIALPVSRKLKKILPLADAQKIAAGLEKAEAEHRRMIELSDKPRRQFWKAKFALSCSDADGSEQAQKWIEEHPSKTDYAAAGARPKLAARNRLELALRSIAPEVSRWNAQVAGILRESAATLETGLEAAATAAGLEFTRPPEIEELRIQAAEVSELATAGKPPSSHILSQNLGGLLEICRARVALEPGSTKPKKHVAAEDDGPLPIDSPDEADPMLALAK